MVTGYIHIHRQRVTHRSVMVIPDWGADRQRAALVLPGLSADQSHMTGTLDGRDAAARPRLGKRDVTDNLQSAVGFPQAKVHDGGGFDLNVRGGAVGNSVAAPGGQRGCCRRCCVTHWTVNCKETLVILLYRRTLT